MPERTNQRRTLRGTVTSTKPTQTITVEVERTFKHRRYGKYVRSRKKYLVHDDKETARAGDHVEIVATRPLSARKRWRLGSILSHVDLADRALSPDAELAEAASTEGDEA